MWAALGSTAALLLLLQSCVLSEYIPPGPRYRCPKDLYYLSPCTCDEESDAGISVSCKNTNLAKMSVGLGNLAEFRIPVERLTIYKCHVGRLFGSLLYKLQLRLLYIEDTPIETIDEYTFLGVNRTLNELHVLNSNLVEFPKLAFRNLGNLTVLRLDRHNISSMPADAFGGSDAAGTLLKLHITNGNVSALPVEALQPLRRLRTLDLHGNKLVELKRNQFKGLREVEVLDLSHNSLTKLEGSHIADLIKMSWCNVSHNSIKELARGAFARNSVLKVLNMASNKLTKLDSNSFRGMRFLRRLYLSDNLIADVGRGTFGSVNKIGTIDLARNFIKKIDYQMFFQLNFIEIIDVSENNVTEIEKLAFKDVYLTHINLSRNAIKKIERGAFQNCANITVLDLSFNQIANFSKQTFDETTYATELQLSYNFLTNMNQVPLHNMTGLKILNVSHNQITSTPKNSFPKLYELHTIDLSYNNLSDIFNSVFQTLFSLRTLDLSHNSLESIKPSTFGAVPTLLELDMSYNQLKDIARSALTRLASMRRLVLKGNELENLFQLPISVSHLDLSHNRIQQLPAKFWPSMNSLLSLDLSNNLLGDNLTQGSFQNLLTLQKLNLNYNGITKPPWAALNDITALQYIYMEGNEVTTLPRAAFGRLPVVFELNLAHNKLDNVSSKAFEGLLQLLVLNMSGNYIKHIPNGAFQGLVSLRMLDLSYNDIEKIDNKTHGLLDDCLSLEKVNLSHNKISFVTRKTFPSNPYIPYKLREIDLSYNSMPLITFDMVFGTAKLEKLNLSHNAIQDIRRYVLGNLTRLRSLDLSYNMLEDLSTDKDVFKLPTNLSELYLANNLLTTLPWKELRKPHHMKILDLRNNHFDSFGQQLTLMVNNNTEVYFEGNELNCNCFVRPLKRYFYTQLQLQPFYQAIKCRNPPYLLDEYLYQIPDDRLGCAMNVNFTRLVEAEPGEYDLTTDLKIRELKIRKNNLKISWAVVKNDDIADPFVVIREAKNPQNILYSKTLPYYYRKLEIDVAKENLTEIKKGKKGDYEICVLARTSKAGVKAFFSEQCRDITEEGVFTGGQAAVKSTIFIVSLSLILRIL